MFQKFQDGALFFESGSKIPQVRLTIFSRVISYDYLVVPFNISFFFIQAKLSIVLDDAPNASKEDIVKEFKSNLSQFVLEVNHIA